MTLATPLRAEPITVATLAERAVASHPEVRFYEAEIAAAKGGQKSAASVANPELETSFGTWRVKDLNGGGRSDGPAWAVTLGQTIEWPGRLALRKAIALKKLEVAQLGMEQFKSLLAGKVRTGAWALLAAQEKARVIDEAAKRLGELATVLLQRDPAGPAPRLEARTIQASALALGSQAAKAHREEAEAKFALNQLLGEKPDHKIEVKREKLALAPVAELTKLLAAARDHNFEMRARVLDVEQQGFEVKLAENERWPAFKVSPYFQQQRADTRETSVGIGISIPLPLWNRNKGAIDTAKARQTQAEVMLAAQLRELERAVASHRSEYESFVSELAKWPADTLEDLRKAAGEADEHYRLGALPLGTYIELQKQTIEAVEAVLEAQQGALKARGELEILTGLNLNK